MLTLTRNQVGTVARTLIKANGQTTTLEVKNFLRELGVWAVQDEVRNYMLDITGNSSDIEYVDGPGYRVYAFKAPQALAGTDHILNNNDICVECGRSGGAIKQFGWTVCPAANTPKLASDMQVMTDYLTPATPTVSVTPPVHRDDVLSTYEVTDRLGMKRCKYYNVSRSQAKANWARDMGEFYDNARTRKLS